MPNSTESLDAKRMAALQAVFKKSDEEGVSADDLDAVEKLAQELIAHGVSAEAVTASGPLNAEIVKALGPRMPGALFHAIQEIQGAGKEVVGAFKSVDVAAKDMWVLDPNSFPNEVVWILGKGTKETRLTQHELDTLLIPISRLVQAGQSKDTNALRAICAGIQPELLKSLITGGTPLHDYAAKKIPKDVLLAMKASTER